MWIFMIGFIMTIIGAAGIEGTIPLWQGFLISFGGIITMFIGVIRMAYQGADYWDKYDIRFARRLSTSSSQKSCESIPNDSVFYKVMYNLYNV